MILDVIKAFKSELNSAIGANMLIASPDVDFIKDGTLQKNKINLMLFSSSQNDNLTGGIPYIQSVTKIKSREVTLKKPPLSLSLNMLLIFNLSEYDDSISYYQKIIAYLYTNSILTIQEGGQDKRIDILLSNFNTREELEIWNNFKVSGIPLLRYELNYAQVNATTTLKNSHPIIRRAKSVIDPGDENIPPDESGYSSGSGTEVTIVNTLYMTTKELIELINIQIDRFISFDGSNEETFKANWSLICRLLEYVKASYNSVIEHLEKEKSSPFMEDYQCSINALAVALSICLDHLKDLGNNQKTGYDELYQRWLELVKYQKVKSSEETTSTYLSNNLQQFKQNLITDQLNKKGTD